MRVATIYQFKCAVDADVRVTDDVTIDGAAYNVLSTDKGRSEQMVQTVTLVKA